MEIDDIILNIEDGQGVTAKDAIKLVTYFKGVIRRIKEVLEDHEFIAGDGV